MESKIRYFPKIFTPFFKFNTTEKVEKLPWAKFHKFLRMRNILRKFFTIKNCRPNVRLYNIYILYGRQMRHTLINPHLRVF